MGSKAIHEDLEHEFEEDKTSFFLCHYIGSIDESTLNLHELSKK